MDLSLSDVTKLSGILQENGDQILDGTSKLSISVNLLQYLNKCFNLITDEEEIQDNVNTQFQVIHSSNLCLDVFRDLQFLHDFIQKVIGLKITYGINITEPFEGTACISKFRNLKLLEIRKIPVTYITGIKSLRSQIQYLICVKSLINTLDELLIQCGGDNCTTPFVWCELREASFSYNNLTTLDATPFEYVPCLQMLDLSHNKLVNVQSLSCLHNLKHLNLSYNQLERLPLFSQEQSKHLQTLILKNNYIEDLAGLISLLCLRELDVSCNCLIDHSTLFAIPMLANLQILCLEGNPLSCHPNHRKITCRYLHNNTISVKFILDNMLLSRNECMQIGTYHTNSVRLNEYLQERRDYLNTSLTNSGTFSSVSSLESIKPAIKTELRQRTRKGRKVREAIISEPNIQHHLPEKSSEINVNNLEQIGGDGSGSLESSIHLETKKQIEGLREQYGDLWLHSKGSSLIVQDILGMEKTPMPMFSSSPYLDIAKYVTASDNENSISNSPNSLKTIVPENESSTITDETYETAAASSEVTSDYNTIIDSNYESGYDESGNVETEEDNEPEQEEEEDDVNSKLFVVYSESKPDDQLFLCVSIEEKIIRERNAINGVIRERWPLSILQSCERTEKGVSLQFDTVKRDKQSRNYILEDESEAQNLIALLREVLDSRPLIEMNQTVYRCMKCSSQFATENEIVDLQSVNIKGTQCPFCESTIVVEIEEEFPKLLPPLITARDLSPETAEIALPHSPSHSSIAFDDHQISGAPSRVLKVTADVHAPATSFSSQLQPPTHCSATSLNDSIISSKINVADNATRKGDSDIEVLSDPSQDSIEVLAVLARGSSLTPKRRRSSEERRFDMLSPILSTTSRDPPEAEITTTGLSTTGIVAGLTESSSSDSLTDSVCTAYEQRKLSASNIVLNGKSTNSVQIIGNDMSKKQDENTLYEQPELEITVSEPKTAESVGILSSMLEGLWNATSSLTSTAKASTVSQYKVGDVEFSYTNFTQIDHRVKLHLFLNIFEDENEELVWLLRAEILSHNAEQTFSGCVVLSTRKIYVLKIEGDIIGDEPQQWLFKSEGYTVDQLQTVFTLPWKQGIGFEIRRTSLVGVKSSIYILCFLQDLVYTTNFLAHLADATLPDECELITKTSEKTKLDIVQLMLSCSSETDADLTVRLFHVFTQCAINNNNSNNEDANNSSNTIVAQRLINMGVLLVTNNDMILTDSLAWIQPESTKTPSVYSTQSISNLVEVIRENNTIILNFLDESTNKNEQWQLMTISNSAIDNIIEAIRAPWEQLFSIPLQVNIKPNSDCIET